MPTPAPCGPCPPLLPRCYISGDDSALRAALDTPQSTHSPTALIRRGFQQAPEGQRPATPRAPKTRPRAEPRAGCGPVPPVASTTYPSSQQCCSCCGPRSAARGRSCSPASASKPPRAPRQESPPPGSGPRRLHCASPRRPGAPRMIAAGPGGGWQKAVTSTLLAQLRTTGFFPGWQHNQDRKRPKGVAGAAVCPRAHTV